MLYVVMVPVDPFVPFTPGMSRFPLTCMVLNVSPWLFQVDFCALDVDDFTRQVVVSPIGFGRIWVLGLMSGFGRTLFPRLLFFLSRTRSHRYLGFWLSLISLMLSPARP